ncbi:MAG TPA: GTP cyclohydrolase I FolE [Acidimicrobiia bacterium]|nr:GTP cyclohydrolase I FolE [Acidimicrobiia bacterium]
MTISQLHPVFVDQYGGLRSDDRERVDPAVDAWVDLDAAEIAVADLLVALGQDLDTEDLRETPRRVATALAELLTPQPFSMTTFANDEGYDELVVVRDIAFHSLCAHHLLPFIGVAHVAYVPGERIVGLSKLARVVEHFARRPQLQERLTRQVADALEGELTPRGVGVAMEATHLCMSLRGVCVDGARTRTTAVRGVVRDDPATRSEFSTLVGAP